MRKIREILAIAFAVYVAGCSPVRHPNAQTDDGDGKPSSGKYVLPVIETTDIHGHIVTVDGDAVEYGLAYIADKADDIRGNDRSRLLLLDGGDLYQGASVSNLLDGKPVYVSIDKMKYDAVALGNHEFDWNISTLIDEDATLADYDWEGEHFVNEVPVVCANIYKDGLKVPYTRDYVIVEKTAAGRNGETIKVKIAVIGFAMDYASSIMTSKFTGKGYSLKEDYSIVNKIADELENSGECDATVLLTHGRAEYAAKKLGKGSKVDLVLGGHSHQATAGKASSGIAYMQGGRYAENYAYSDMVFNYSRDTDRISFNSIAEQQIIGQKGDLSGKDGNNVSEEIIAVSDEAMAAISRQMNDVVGYITMGATTFSIAGSGERSSLMGNWMCDIIRRIGDADVAFVNSGGIRTYFPLNGLNRRDITVSDVYEMFPFGNTTYVFDITYADLLLLFDYSLTSSGSSIFSFMTGLDCHYKGRTVVALKKDGRTIYSNGRWESNWETRHLTLAVSEYLATSDRIDSKTGLANPLLEWSRTSRLLFNSEVDNENAVRVLRDEAAASDGHLYIDNKPHFILTE